MAHCYYVDDLEHAAPGDIVTLTGAEAHHAVTVSRMRRGEHVTIGNGRGLLCDATIEVAERGSLDVRIADALDEPAPHPRIGLAQALAKGDRAELAVQAATELGVDVIVPWQADRSIVRWSGERATKGEARWASIAREAGKQAIRARVPAVASTASTAQLAALAADWRVLVLEPTASSALVDVELDERDVLLVVGPEGGIAPSELERLEEAGAEQVRLGSMVLRTSTAGLAGITAVSLGLGRWRA